MPALGRGQASNCTTPTLDIFTRVGGVLTDISELSFQIFEKVSSPGVPVQVYPATLGDRQTVDLSLCPVGGRVSTGRYHADYTVPLGELIGTHEIRWYFKLLPSSPEQQYFEEFEVLGSPVASASDQYISVEDVRAAGLNVDPPSDGDIQAAILTWQQFIDRACRQWFRPIQLEFYVDGTDSDSLHFGVPIISISELRINGSATALEESRYKIYSSAQYPENRGNPRIKLVDSMDQSRDIYTASMRNGRSLFRKGRQNQYISGVFGYVESDGSAPLLIQRALAKLVVEKLARPIAGLPPAGILPPVVQGILKEEWTDGHRVRYEFPGGPLTTRQGGPLAGITNDPEIQAIIRMYRAPIGIATPANSTYR
jgi:hypothetical protein